MQKSVDETNKRIKAEEDLISELECSGGKVMAEATRLREEIKTLENESEMAEEDKAMKDNTISTLREEIRHQEQLITKLQKEKKGAGESRQKTEEVPIRGLIWYGQASASNPGVGKPSRITTPRKIPHSN